MLTAVVLAGGRGTRLGPLTDDTPKPMVELLGRPLLAHVLDLARHAGAGRAVVACGYRAEAIERAFEASFEGMTLEYAVEDAPLGTGGAARLAAAGLDEAFLVLNADSLSQASVDELVRAHREGGAAATVLLARRRDDGRFGIVELEDGRVVAFDEKPTTAPREQVLVNAGIYVLEPAVLGRIPSGRNVSLEREVFPRLAADGELAGVELPGLFVDAGTPSGYLEAHESLLASQRPTVAVDRTAFVHPSAVVVGPVAVGPEAFVGAGVRLGPMVSLGRASRIEGPATTLSHVAVLAGATVRAGTTLHDAILHPQHGALEAEGH